MKRRRPRTGLVGFIAIYSGNVASVNGYTGVPT
jgi:hypothetical protein